ncbi:DUF115 domain-containing protein [Heliobacillus mobilis]|uniref:DUF115 domain-containing protein n=1 Tax=Heliobacterium mobile TaxID=28064 RepID=A0A6I3SMS0_HELMO|nr:6-hydroxymethylpterin diphosphokinase MptE-like protein [Heliobacterium mobile]MTV49637.1 DUF115 domain-containing protein [Heliobacterium mobile]
MQFVPPPYVRFLNDNIFEANIRALATVQPPLAERMAQYKPPYNQPFQVELTPSGDLTLLIDTGQERIFLHSPIDPQKQAREWVQEVVGDPTSLLVVFGFGLGYTMKILRQIIPAQGKIVLFERSIDIFWLALWTINLRDVLSDPRIRYAVDVDSSSVAPIMHHLNLSANDALSAQLYEFHYLTALFDGYYESVKESLDKFFQTQQIGVATENYFSQTWTINFLRNLPAVLQSSPVCHLYGRFPSVPAVIIAAGPSLDKNIEQLRHFSKYGLLIATGPSLRKLQQRGIRPHLVVSIDGGSPNFSHFQGIPADDVPLVFDSTIYPSILDTYWGGGNRFCLFAPDKAGLYGILSTAFDVSRSSLNVGASVANLGLNLAYHLGCDPIVFVGQDLAFTGRHSHVRGSAHDQSFDGQDMSQYIEMEDIYGQKTYTQETWLAFRDWFHWFIQGYPGRRYINATEGGIGIPGTEVSRLADVIEQLEETRSAVGRGPFRTVITEAYATGERELSLARGAVVKELHHLRRHLKIIVAECRKGEELIVKHQRFATGKMDVDKRFAQYYKKLDKIRQRIEGDKKTMDFLRLAFRPITIQLDQSMLFSEPVDEREAIQQDLVRGKLFFAEVSRRSEEILSQMEQTIESLQALEQRF